jgi:YHS domain-containing protein
MFRAIAYLIASILFLTLIRSVIGAISRLFSGFVSSPETPSPSQPRRGPDMPVAELLQKDPVCGAFVAPSAAVQKVSSGKTYYFCSAACRDKFV